MLRPRVVVVLAPLLSTVFAACGDGSGEAGRPTRTITGSGTVPRLAQAPAKPGELVLTAESSPASHGPLELDGSYVVRFEQAAPEDPKLDFAGQTPFTAMLERRAGDPRGAVKLFGSARRRGHRRLTLHGRYLLDVSFGDFPYAVRFTLRR